MFHDLETLGSIHIPHNWEYADQAAREGATGFVATDLRKQALQLDDLSLWILIDETPTWEPVSKGATGGFTTSTPANELDAAFFAEDAGASDAYAITLNPAIASYVTGVHYMFKAATANTGAATININGLGAKTIKKAAGGITTDLATDDIRAGQWVLLVYDGTNMQMLSLLGNSPSASGFSSSTKADVLDAAFFAQDAGGSDSYAITLTPAITAYVTGCHYVFKANTANTGAATLNINALGAITIKKAAGGITTDLATDDIRAGQWVIVVYDGTNFQMVSLLGNAPSGGGGTGTKTLMRWDANDSQAPAANFASFGARNAIPFVAFNDTTAQSTVFLGIIPEGADFTTGIKVRFKWIAASATSGNTIWTSAFERMNTDVDADSFATGVDSTAQACNATNGIPTSSEIDHSGSEIDGLTAGDLFRIKLTRKAADGGDTMTGDAQLLAVEIQQR
jgi:hypothetical protein